jgi:hypothetical protein
MASVLQLAESPVIGGCVGPPLRYIMSSLSPPPSFPPQLNSHLEEQSRIKYFLFFRGIFVKIFYFRIPKKDRMRQIKF